MKQPWIVLRSRHVPFSVRIDRRVPPVLILVLLVTLAAMVINIGVGEYQIAPLDVIKTVFHLPTGSENYDFVVNTLRLPRMLVAALVGMALGISGTILQGLTRNPLADPNIIGVSSGAALFAVALIIWFKAPASAIPFGALCGALLIAGMSYLLAWRGGDSPLRLILVGIGLSSLTGAATSLLLTFGNTLDVQAALIWLSGSLYSRSWSEFWAMMPWVIVFVPLALLLARDLNALNLGEEVARGLGSRVALKRGLLLLVAVALAASSVAAAGTVGFVSLMAPHVARRLVGPDHNGLIPTAGTFGAFIVVVADLVGRTLIAPTELPVGLMTAAIGAPFFLTLLWRQRRV